MKKNIIALTIATGLLSLSSFAQAESASALLQWEGVVGGAFNSSEIALTGPGGGEIQHGKITVGEDAMFSTSVPIVVEAHKSKDYDGTYIADADMYDADVDWTIGAASVMSSDGLSYDSSKLVFEINGQNVVGTSGDVVTTTADQNVISVSTFYATPFVGSPEITPGSTVSVMATVYAQPNAGETTGD